MQKQTQLKKQDQVEAEEIHNETQLKKKINIKFTVLGSSQVDTLEVDEGTRLKDIITLKKAGAVGEIRVSRNNKSLALDREEELQEGDTVVWIKQRISGGCENYTA